MATAPPCRLLALAVLLGPASAAAQTPSLDLPASFVAPNYDRVFVGVAEAHEAGAYLARTGGPAASWYNAAGLATLETSTVSVNVRGAEVGVLSIAAPISSSTQVSELSVLPLFVSLVLGPDLLPWKDVRVSFSGTEQTSWSTLAWWGATEPDGHRTYVSDSGLSSWIVAGSVAWAVSPAFRCGASLGGSATHLFQNDRLSAFAAPGAAEGTVRTRLVSGLVFHAVPSVALQWEPVPWFALGAVARAPGMKIWGEATLQAERADTSGSTSRNAFVQDGAAAFDLRQPAELQAGVAFRSKAWELELDARFHASAGDYTVLASDAPVQDVSTPPGGPPVTSPFTPVAYAGRAALDVALGGSWALREKLRLHGGLYYSPSPVAPGPAFRSTDLWGVRSGVSFEASQVSFSIGLGYERAEQSASPGLETLEHSPVDDAVLVQHLSLTLAAEYRR